MTHILKPGLFECHDMWHHREAPRTQCDTSWVNESPKFRGFVQAGWTGNMGRVWLRGRKEWGGSIESKKPTSWGWDILKGRACHKRVWGLKPESGDTEVENKGQAWVWLLKARRGFLEGSHALLFKRTFPPFSPSLCSAFSLSSLSLLASDFPKTLRGRRPTEQSQSHHLDLSKHSGEGSAEERGKREGDRMWRGTNSLHDRGRVF